MSLPKRSRENCISVLEKWIDMINNTATNGELKLTEKGTYELKNALAWVRGYLQDLDREKVEEALDGIKMPQRVEVDELPTKPPFKEAEYIIYVTGGKEYIWLDDEWELVGYV